MSLRTTDKSRRTSRLSGRKAALRKQPHPSLWEKIDALIADVPDREWSKLPKDGSINLDHYLYGIPKQQP